MKEIPIDQLEISDLNVRQQPYPFGDLEDSIAEHGVLNPLLVVESENGRYGVVCGSMRFHAARAAGLETVPCVIRNLSDEQAIVLSLTENIQRGDLTLEEEADGVAKLYEIHESQDKVADALGKSRRWVRERLETKGLIDTIADVHMDDGRHAAIPSLPQDASKISRITSLGKTLFPDDKEKQLELFELMKDKNRRDIQRVANSFREMAEDGTDVFVENPLDDMVSDVFHVDHVDVNITFSAKLSKGIEKVAVEREISYEDVVEIAVEQWLKQEGYLD